MPSFEETLARMKGLYTYGKELNESSNLKTHTLEHHAVAADGRTYGIIKENSKYYIKSAPKGKETIAEAYEYLGGFCNKKNYEYTSYANALKQFELKMASINEACDSKVNIETLNPFRSNEVLAEATDAMRDEIARQRQIMYNVSMLMNESTEIGADRKNDVVKFDGKNPEAETGKKGDEGTTKATAQPEYKGSKTNGVQKKVTPFDNNTVNAKDQLKEESGDIGDAPLHPNTENWGTEGIGKGREPEQVGWDIEGQQKVNEEEEDWASKGLPSSAGVGEADTDHNNTPFNKGLNEGEFDDETDDVEGDDMGSDDPDLGVGDEPSEDGDDMASDTDFDAGVGDVEDVPMGDDEDNLDSELDGEEPVDDEPTDEPSDDNDLLAQIESLQAQLDALRAQVDGGADSVDGDLDGGDEDLGGDGLGSDEIGGEDGLEGDDDIAGSEPSFDGDGESFDNGESEDFGEDDFGAEGEDNLGDDDDLDECGMGGMDAGMGGDMQQMPMNEAKRAFMNKIVESVVKDILKEDELHVFGKHPGYRKKPMELPTTGEDKNQWGEDWNDESAHSEEPFGSKIGDGMPFNKLVDAITKDVMYQLKAGIPIEGENKKKED